MHVQTTLGALRTAIPYIRNYRGQIFVVKLGGELCAPGRVLENLTDQLSLLHQLSIKLVIVHGGGPQATALSRQLGLTPQVVAGRRVTDAGTLDAVKMAFAGTLNTDLVAALQAAHVSAVGLSGIDAGMVLAQRRAVQSLHDPSTGENRVVDFGFVGDIREIRTDLLRSLLDGGRVPVICSLAADQRGQVLNVNADTLAAELAVALGAAKYFVVSNVDGVLRDIQDPTTLQSYLDVQQLNELVDSGAISGGMLPKLAAGIRALRGGVPRVHIVNGQTTDALLCEVFTNEGCGTLLVARQPPRGDPAPDTALTADEQRSSQAVASA